MICPKCNNENDDELMCCEKCNYIFADTDNIAIKENESSKKWIDLNQKDVSGQIGKRNPNVNMFVSFLSLLFFLPIGIIAVIFSIKSKNQIKSDNIDKAITNSNRSMTFSMIAIVIGIISIIGQISLRNMK
jgi:hypothetical protein